MKLNYTAKVQRLEEIVSLMENSSMPLEETMALYEEGRKLLKECRDYLSSAEEKITVLDENGEEKEFDGEEA